jgi:hypothetical protein
MSGTPPPGQWPGHTARRNSRRGVARAR